MELFQLRYFIEVAKQQHVRRSAETLHVSQPAVTNAIHRLEAELGVELFASQGRNIKLTPCGKFLYDEVLPFFKSLKTLPVRIKEVASQENSTVRINILSAWTLIMEAVIEYQRIDNDLRIQLIENELPEEADITISTMQHYRLGKKDKDIVHICTEPIYLAVPNIERFRKKNTISLKDVEDEGFIQLSGSKTYRSICDRFCALADVHPQIIFESDSPTAVKNMISANMGVGFWPGFSWGNVDPKRVLLKTITKPHCSRDLIIARRKDSDVNMRTKLFYDYLVRYVEIYRERSLERIKDV